MTREVCIHGVPVERICIECINGDYSIGEGIDAKDIHLAENDDLPTEREELVLKFALAMAPTQHYTHPKSFDTLLQLSVALADTYLKWREEKRAK